MIAKTTRRNQHDPRLHDRPSCTRSALDLRVGCNPAGRVRVRRPERVPSARLQRRYPGLAVAGLLFFIFTISEPYTCSTPSWSATWHPSTAYRVVCDRQIPEAHSAVSSSIMVCLDCGDTVPRRLIRLLPYLRSYLLDEVTLYTGSANAAVWSCPRCIVEELDRT